VLEHRKPARPAQPVAVPPTTDEFDGDSLGLQWQWQANPGTGWATVGDGRLRLEARPPAAPNLWAAPHLLLQKFPAERFSVTTLLTVEDGARAGLVVFGTDYLWVGLERRGDGVRLVARRCRKAIDGAGEEEVVALPWSGDSAEMRATVGAGASVRLDYRRPDGFWQVVPGAFTAQPGRWVGAKVGLFAERLDPARPAAASVAWFRVSPAVPVPGDGGQ
jgi:beta-xylosidase